MKRAKQNKNFLEYIPKRNEEIEFYEKDDLIVLKKEHKGLFNKIAQKMFFAPSSTNLTLESYGSDVYRMIDGKKSILEIGQELKEKYGDEVEPLYERLSQYINILYSNGIVELKEKLD